MIDEFGEQVDFVLLYTAEAHASDGWAFKNNPFGVRRHRSLEERINAAKSMFELKVPCPVLVDRMDDMFSAMFQSQGERLYVVNNGRVVYQGGRGPFFYDIDHTRTWLTEYMAFNFKKQT